MQLFLRLQLFPKAQLARPRSACDADYRADSGRSGEALVGLAGGGRGRSHRRRLLVQRSSRWIGWTEGDTTGQPLPCSLRVRQTQSGSGALAATVFFLGQSGGVGVLEGSDPVYTLRVTMRGTLQQPAVMGSVQVAHVPTEQEQQAAAEIAEMMEKARRIMQDPEKVPRCLCASEWVHLDCRGSPRPQVKLLRSPLNGLMVTK